MNEIKILSNLKYPTLLTLYGITIIPSIDIITEYLPNNIQHYINLASRGQGDDNWNITNKMISVIGIALGMRYLHANNIAHRDLKPGNVLLDSNFYPRICDFGLSKTKSGSMSSNVGTPQFWAPEVAYASKTQKYDGEKVDVYSYGMTIYSILYDQIPFDGLEIAGIIREVVFEKNRPTLGGKISKKIDKK